MQKRMLVSAAVCAAAMALPAPAVVFINEVLINPPGNFDDTREFIELMGTPGMHLDGYAVALVNGMQAKYYPLDSIPPLPNPVSEVDEFFSLDGLSLGANGMLVLGIGPQTNYPTLLADSNFQRWNGLWNGGLDTTGKLSNDGSNTAFLVRNRPGRTQANPGNAAGLRWGKDISVDYELFTPVVDPQSGLDVDQFGDGALDFGQPSGLGTDTFDLLGISTPELTDDLEIVDEISYEHDRGWEYDIDQRKVDDGSTDDALPKRRVHALDDPGGFNPDCLTRVDYRTTGAGWTPAVGAVGELPNGNNWQDTATEQWVRGESVQTGSGQGAAPFFYFSVTAVDPNSGGVQPYATNVPLWLAPNFAFAAPSYQIMAGRVNPLAVPFIPGDTDRNGLCDANDIAKVAAVFGDSDWVYPNADPNGVLIDADPATTTKPWDVDATGDNGIECSDLQWTLNFQGDATGRIVGRTYDSATPAVNGVYLNANTGVFCRVTATTATNALTVGQTVDLVVSGSVVVGANQTAGQQNGIMQFVQDVLIDTAGVLRVTAVTPVAPFATTRATLQTPLGSNGDLGIATVNGYTTSFAQGLNGLTPLYVVSLKAVGAGTAQVSIASAAEASFATSTPAGVKIGHTDNHGDPAGNSYGAPVTFTVTAPSVCLGDVNCDGAVTFADIDPFVSRLGCPASNPTACNTPSGCGWQAADINNDGAVTFADIDPFVGRLGAVCGG